MALKPHGRLGEASDQQAPLNNRSETVGRARFKRKFKLRYLRDGEQTLMLTFFRKTAESGLLMVSFEPMGTSHHRNIAILVVEDESLIRVDATSFLESEGFIVFEAEHADEAIRRLEVHREIRLIFTDVNMPGSLNGLALAHYVADAGPPSKLS
jgi:hypothetical protein